MADVYDEDRPLRLPRNVSGSRDSRNSSVSSDSNEDISAPRRMRKRGICELQNDGLYSNSIQTFIVPESGHNYESKLITQDNVLHIIGPNISDISDINNAHINLSAVTDNTCCQQIDEKEKDRETIDIIGRDRDIGRNSTDMSYRTYTSKAVWTRSSCTSVTECEEDDLDLQIPSPDDQEGGPEDEPEDSDFDQTMEEDEDCFTPLPDFARLRKISRADQTDMATLKNMTCRLNLNPRRPSYLAWKAKHVDDSKDDSQENANSNKSPVENMKSKRSSGIGWTQERAEGIDSALEWLRDQLNDMKKQDYALAKQLVRLRGEIQHLRLQKSYQQHKELLEDAIEEEKEEKDLESSDLCDLPPRLFNPELKHYGLTRMNITTRRFSVF